MSENRSGPSYRAVVFISVLVSLLVSAAMVVGLARLAPNLFAPPVAAEAPATVEVPDLVGVPRAAASELLTGRGLRMLVAEERPDAEAAEGSVAAQRPLAGSQVDRGSAVSVDVSTGVPMITIPELLGRPLADVRAAIERLGLAVGEVSETGQGTPGTVSALDPAVGAEVAPGTRVRITAVAAGVAVPDLVRLDRRRAQTAITAAGFTMGPVEWRYDDSRPPYIVLAQTPAAGTLAPPGSAITLTLSRE